MWKWLILAAAAYILYRLFANDLLKKKKDGEKTEAEETARKVQAGEMVKDPECGVYVSADAEVTVRDGEKVYRFCSYDCRDKFLQRLKEGGGRLSS
ncbi:MAG: transcriptional regulator [Desulfovibrio sp.]|jgi:YHS domain-containing protein|nr:transcriptional regulator [Desulfovibrio sp.]